MSGMNGTEQISPVDVMESVGGQPVPAARPLGDFCMERVGDDVVLYDAETLRYHTLNTMAYDIWRLCDGVRSVEQIGFDLQRGEIQFEVIDAAIAQLGEAGLLQAPEDHFEARVPRRKLLKMAVAGAVGAAVLPVVKSVTVPDAAAAATAKYCIANGYIGTCTNHGSCQSAE